jgi:hypothetical protein
VRQHAQLAVARAHLRALDPFNSELHRVMTELGERLGVAGTTGARVLAVMGEPDDRKPGR